MSENEFIKKFFFSQKMHENFAVRKWPIDCDKVVKLSRLWFIRTIMRNVRNSTPNLSLIRYCGTDSTARYIVWTHFRWVKIDSLKFYGRFENIFRNLFTFTVYWQLNLNVINASQLKYLSRVCNRLKTM